ncbi:MAG: chorismate synthase [Acidobacteria bacterium RIFCSPLOWO2_12_FULL_65_11]|nr:MAG: chorismate synthase [Acidobacteria bacterium RIFCSPLOWO2_02_FULL_64_15]OFW33178.1 MAG: chorismate synthase [Acidobacteria bacterium RIFCSPLOWO2_12_FULL_65_11]
MLRFLTAGESHGKALVAILEGIPAGLPIDFAAITTELRRRQGGYGRGRRMAIESDRAEALAGIRRGLSTGGPIALLIPNKDWDNWQRTMAVEADLSPDAGGTDRPPVTRPRPGHADLSGSIKYGHDDIRNVLERASARETAARVAVGAIARQLLGQLGTHIVSHVISIGSVSLPDSLAISYDQVRRIAVDGPLHCVDGELELQMIAEIDRARDAGDTMGGSFEVIAHDVPPGLGSYVQWDRKLDGRLGQAVMSIPAIKAVGIGRGAEVAALPGSRVHDEILPPAGTGPATAVAVTRPTNNAGGLEGGVTNGQDLRITGYMKPIATLMKPLRSVDLATMTESPAAIERSDVCAVPAAAVVAEAMVAFVLADAAVEKFGGDSVDELVANWRAFRDRTSARFTRR